MQRDALLRKMPQPFSWDYRKMNIRALLFKVISALWGVFKGFGDMEYGYIAAKDLNANFKEIGMKNDFLPADPEEFAEEEEYERQRDHLEQAAWSSQEDR